MQGDVLALYNMADSSLTLVATYEYDPWGKLLAIRNAVGTDITASPDTAGVNPLRYRGYYYDEETGFYYLQSRYYDPAIGRFINADSFASTGQSFLGYNMFAYCENCPIDRNDPSGAFFTEIIGAALFVGAVFLTACATSPTKPREDLANAPDLDITSASNESYNCFGNAINKQIVANPTGYVRGDSVDKTFDAVQKDLGGERNCRKLASWDAEIEDGWYKVAMMCGDSDYHFIRYTEKGWYNKSGFNHNVGGCYLPEDVVLSNTWYGYGEVNGVCIRFRRPIDPIYHNDDGPLFFAVREEWYK